jgi:hypothetical protein
MNFSERENGNSFPKGHVRYINRISSFVKMIIYKENFLESYLIYLLQNKILKSILIVQRIFRGFLGRMKFKSSLLRKRIVIFEKKLTKLQARIRYYLYHLHHILIFPKAKRYKPILAKIRGVKNLDIKSPYFLSRKENSHKFMFLKSINKFVYLLDTHEIRKKELFLFNFIADDEIIVDPSYSMIKEKNCQYYNTLKINLQGIERSKLEEIRLENSPDGRRKRKMSKNLSSDTDLKGKKLCLKSILVNKNFNSLLNLHSIETKKKPLKSVKWSKENIVLHY